MKIKHQLPLLFLICMGFLSACAGTATRTGKYIDDSVITAKVKTALIQSDEVNGLDVSIETYQGIVQLSGFVKSAEMKKAAERIAAGVNGVLSVKNEIALK